MKIRNLTTLLLIALIAVSCNSGKIQLSGAGATFPAPFYNIVVKEFAKEYQTDVSYGATGSGSGIRNLKDLTIDFGGTDVFLSDQEMKDMPAEVIHVPTCLGAVVVAYNLKEVSELHLDSETITDIFTGKITNWNDPKLAALNPGVTLPDQTITVVYRSDGSGTTAVFSGYMSEASAEWKSAIGEGKSLNFPVGIAAKGNPGVAGSIAETVGAIGYIGSEYAFALNIPSAKLKNRAGNFVAANSASIAASATEDFPDDTRTVIYNSDNPDAYPISTLTWLIAYREQSYNGRSGEQAELLKVFLSYVISDKGGEIASKTHYVALPPAAKNKAMGQINSMTFEGKPLN